MRKTNIKEYIGSSGNHYLIELELGVRTITKLRKDRSQVHCAVIPEVIDPYDFIEWFDNKYPNHGESEE